MVQSVNEQHFRTQKLQLDHLEIEVEKSYVACLIEQTVPLTPDDVSAVFR